MNCELERYCLCDTLDISGGDFLGLWKGTYS